MHTLEHDARKWDERVHAQGSSAGLDPDAQGRAAYAAKQAAVRRTLKSRFAEIWGALETLAQVEADLDGQEDDVAAFRSFDSDESDVSEASDVEE